MCVQTAEFTNIRTITTTIGYEANCGWPGLWVFDAYEAEAGRAREVREGDFGTGSEYLMEES